MEQKGFTLIELLVVIAILAILAAIVVITINPAELLRQARDSSRITDMKTLNTALGLYLADQSSPTMVRGGVYTWCYMSNATSSTNCGGRHTTNSLTTTSTAAGTNRNIDGTGWIPVPFSSMTAGANLSALPVDPVNSGALMYSYAASSTNAYEIGANMESSRYANNGTSNVESTDGGNNADIYELGSNLSM